MSDRTPEKSLRVLLRSMGERFQRQLILALLFLAILGIFFTLSGTHQIVCSFVDSSLKSMEGPLGRELLLGADETARALFDEFKQKLAASGITGELSLFQNPFTDSKKSCEATVLGSVITHPLKFSGETLGEIRGRVAYFSFWKTAVFVLMIILIVGFAFRLIISGSEKILKEALVDPVLALSEGHALNNTHKNIPLEVSRIRENLESMKTTLINQERENARLVRDKELSDFSSQVAHDLGSPLTALNIATEDLSGISETNRMLIRTATKRIKEISSTLIAKNRDLKGGVSLGSKQLKLASETTSVEHLPSLIDEIVLEKKVEYKEQSNVSIEFQLSSLSYALFSHVNAGDFRTVLSNLINNAVESQNEMPHALVGILLEYKNERIHIKVIDHGKGISKERLDKLGRRGATFGKENGSGLGLYHARVKAEGWGGNLAIESVEGQGTTIIIQLLKVQDPPWFVPQISVTNLSQIVVLDDDESIHNVWNHRFEKKISSNKIFHFLSFGELKKWIGNDLKEKQHSIFLIDYEFYKEKESGLDIIEELGIREQSILVTSCYADSEMTKRCMDLGVRLLPKNMAGFVPLC